MSAFQILGLESTLLLEEGIIKRAYELNSDLEGALEARNILLNPCERLRVWMECQNISIVRHSSIPESILNLFSDIASLTTEVNTLHHQRVSSQTTLGQALLDKKLFQLKPKIDAIAEQVSSYEQKLVDSFHELESTPEERLANKVYQGLKFLNKWKTQLDDSYNRLIVC